jgi:hypothetical protein
LGKLTFTIYVVHVAIILYQVAKIGIGDNISVDGLWNRALYVDGPVIWKVALLLTLLIEIPVLNATKFLLE